MPIPTRTSPTKPNPRPDAAIRVSSRDTDSRLKSTKTPSDRSQEQTARLPSSIKKSQLQTRVPARSTTRTTSSTLRPARTPSTNATSNKTVSESAATSSRASSASSNNVPQPTKPSIVKPSIQPKTATSTALSNRTRTVSGSTTSTTATRTPPAPSSRLKPTGSTATSTTTRSLRVPNEKPNTSSAAVTTTATKAKAPTSSTKSDVRPTASNSSTSTNTATTSTTTRLRDELYQLQLLHLSAPSTLQQYQTSISTALATKKCQLLTQQASLLTLEAQIQESNSINTLDKWLQHHLGPEHTTNPIQHLSSLIAELSQLTTTPTIDSYSDDLTPLHTFQVWLDDALAIRDERSSSHTHTLTPSIPREIQFIQPLGIEWTSAMHNLQQRLQILVTGFRGLTLPLPSQAGDSHSHAHSQVTSGVEVVVSQHLTLAESLLQEIETAVVIERAVVWEEEVWQRDQLRAVLGGLGGEGVYVHLLESGGTGEEGDVGGGGGVYAGAWTRIERHKEGD